MTVLVGAVEASRILDVTTQAIAKMRDRGALVPVRVKPFRFALADVTRLADERAGRKRKGTRPHRVEFIHEGDK